MVPSAVELYSTVLVSTLRNPQSERLPCLTSRLRPSALTLVAPLSMNASTRAAGFPRAGQGMQLADVAGCTPVLEPGGDLVTLVGRCGPGQGVRVVFLRDPGGEDFHRRVGLGDRVHIAVNTLGDKRYSPVSSQRWFTHADRSCGPGDPGAPRSPGTEPWSRRCWPAWTSGRDRRAGGR